MPPKQQSTKASEDFGSQTPYLINMSKAVQGHKLKMRDFLKIQLMKGRRCSPTKSDTQIIQETQAPKMTEYSDKYRGFDTCDDEEALYKFLEGQRKKNSKHASSRMKMFTQRDTKKGLQDRGSTFRTIATPRDTHTSQTNRPPHSQRTPATPISSIKHYTTISYENSPPIQEPLAPQRGVNFTSENLGRRMNEYMNLVLHKKQKGQIEIREQELKEEAVLMRMRQSQLQEYRMNLAQHKRKSNTFLRQMKKHLKLQYSQRIEESSMRDKVLVRSLAQRTQGNLVDRKHSKITSQTAHFRTIDVQPHPKYTLPHPSHSQRQHLLKTLEEIVSVPSSKR